MTTLEFDRLRHIELLHFFATKWGAQWWDKVPGLLPNWGNKRVAIQRWRFSDKNRQIQQHLEGVAYKNGFVSRYDEGFEQFGHHRMLLKQVFERVAQAGRAPDAPLPFLRTEENELFAAFGLPQ